MFQIKLPEVVLSFASTAGGANAFLALFMIGIGFEIHADMKNWTEIVKILSIRYSIALAFSLIFYFLAPFSLEVRQTLAIVAFGPVSSVSPAFTGKLNGDVELSSAINSLQISDQRGAAYPCTDCGAVGKGIRRLKYNGNLMLVIANNYIITMKNRRYDTMIYRK